jgi:tetratricopeptide (TPR) repeat protein
MNHRPLLQINVWVLASAALFFSMSARAEQDAIAWARENIAAGKYGDARDLLKKALPNFPEKSPECRQATLVLIEALRITGGFGEAREACDALIKADEKDVETRLLKAELDFEVGNFSAAREVYDKIIAEQPDNQRAWALRSILYRALCDRDGLKKTNDHFFNLYQKNSAYYQSDKVKEPLELAYIGLGLQDEIPKDAFEVGFMLAEDRSHELKLKRPEVFLWSARLAHEKYHFGYANERYSEVLKLRPNLPDALAGIASIVLQNSHNLDQVEKMLKEAFAVNPSHIGCLLIAASVDLEEDRYDEAKKKIDAALAVNPSHMQALAMLAFYYLDINQPEKAAEIEKRALAINPKCADYYCEIGELMEDKRNFDTAPTYYRKAINIDPDNWRGYYGLGMNTSRQGAHGEVEGKQILLRSFEKNKFNVWANNMIKSLDRIIGDKDQQVPPVYSESKTKHFTLKFYGRESDIVRPYIEEYAEAAYEYQTKKFGFEPEGPLTIELCQSFEDQAARTVGLPNLGALGVCFGKLSTVVSPREGNGKAHPPFNWRKVLEHEFGHVMTLQLSKFKVPRWYTEAFSTYLEDDSRIQSDSMMVDAITKGRLKDIDKMNEYFRINPMMAYVHGRYVIECLDKAFGFDAHIKMLKMFADGKKAGEALTSATGKTISELNTAQLDFVKKSFEDVRIRPTYDAASIVQVELAAKSGNATAQNIADLAYVQMARRKFPEAEAAAKRALEKDAKCVDAINALGILAYEKKDYEGAKKLFLSSTAIDPKRSFTAWQRLAIIYKKESRTTKAVEAFENARKRYPRYVGENNPHHELPEQYADMEPPQLEKALAVWKDAVAINTEDPVAALKGLQLAMKLKDYKAAVEFAKAHIAINPYLVEVHRLAGQAYEELKDNTLALREYAVGVACDEKDIACWIGLARAQKAEKRIEAARLSVNKALEIDGGNADAKALLEALK